MSTEKGAYSVTDETLRTLGATGWDDTKLGFGDRWNALATGKETRSMDMIKRSVAEIEKLAVLIQEQRIELYEARALRAPISRIPDDVLRLIFQEGAVVLQPYMASTKCPTPFQVICSRVCCHWRRVSLETASLWSRFRITDKRSLNLAIRYRLQRSPTAEFELDIMLKCSVSRAREMLVNKIVDFISRHAERLAVLQLDMCEHAVAQLWASMTGAFSTLKTLAVVFESHAYPCRASANLRLKWTGAGLLHIPGVRRLRIAFGDVPTTFACLPAISSLAFEHVLGTQNAWENLFRCFPNIRELCLDDAGVYGVAGLDGLSTTPVSLNNLNTLEVDDHHAAEHALPLSFLSMPHLQNFKYRNRGASQPMLLLLERQVTLTDVSISFGFKDAAAIIGCLSKSSDDITAVSPQLVSLRLVALDRLYSKRPDDTFWSSLIDMVNRRSTLGCPLKILSISPQPEEETVNWFESKLRFQSAIR